MPLLPRGAARALSHVRQACAHQLGCLPLLRVRPCAVPDATGADERNARRWWSACTADQCSPDTAATPASAGTTGTPRGRWFAAPPHAPAGRLGVSPPGLRFEVWGSKSDRSSACLQFAWAVDVSVDSQG